jgi:hypothetical protein
MFTVGPFSPMSGTYSSSARTWSDTTSLWLDLTCSNLAHYIYIDDQLDLIFRAML